MWEKMERQSFGPLLRGDYKRKGRIEEKRLVGKNRGVRNRSEGERKDTREERELSTRGIMVIQLGR